MARIKAVLFSCLLIVIFINKSYQSDDSWALTFEIDDEDKMCFYHEWKGARRYVLEYEVIRGGRLDIDASVESPNGKVLYSEIKRTKDHFTFDTSYGTFSICFGNEFSTFTHKLVYFELRPEEHETLAVKAGIKKPTVNTQFEESTDVVYENARSIVGHQTEYRLSESRGRYMADELNKKVTWWSIIQSLVILFIGFGQVFALKTFFSEKKTDTFGKQEEIQQAMNEQA